MSCRHLGAAAIKQGVEISSGDGIIVTQALAQTSGYPASERSHRLHRCKHLLPGEAPIIGASGRSFDVIFGGLVGGGAAAVFVEGIDEALLRMACERSGDDRCDEVWDDSGAGGR